jgi:hypothetical protein
MDNGGDLHQIRFDAVDDAKALKDQFAHLAVIGFRHLAAHLWMVVQFLGGIEDALNETPCLMGRVLGDVIADDRQIIQGRIGPLNPHRRAAAAWLPGGGRYDPRQRPLILPRSSV